MRDPNEIYYPFRLVLFKDTMSEEFKYIEGIPPQRKDIPEHPITKMFKAFIFQLRKRRWRLYMVSTTIFHDICPKCGGDLISSVSRRGLEETRGRRIQGDM